MSATPEGGPTAPARGGGWGLLTWTAPLVVGFVVLALNARPTTEGKHYGLERYWGWPLPAFGADEFYECKDKSVWCCGRCSGPVTVESLREHPELWTLKRREWGVFWPFLGFDVLVALVLLGATALVTWLAGVAVRRLLAARGRGGTAKSGP